jgi:lactate dehydrogenase-like 2-hydroxyacid dehydrogenase
MTWGGGVPVRIFCFCSSKNKQIEPELLKLENVILTPHIASATEETRQAMSELAAKNIIAALEGRKPPNVISF